MKSIIGFCFIASILIHSEIGFAEQEITNAMLKRSSSIGLGVSADRSWAESNSDSETARETNTELYFSGSYLFLGQHFHVGPSLSYNRTYTAGGSQNTSMGLGLTGKITYEDLQTAKSTPFLTVRGGIGQSKYNVNNIGDAQTMEASLGYEFFISDWVSVTNGIGWSKVWGKSKSSFDLGQDTIKIETTSATSAVKLEIGLGVYL